MTRCPSCGESTMLQSMREDFCPCGYSERYEDAYAKEDPNGDFENAEDLI